VFSPTFRYLRANIYSLKIVNWLDITIAVLLIAAVWQGWREGLVTQILGLAAIALGIWLGWRHGAAIGSLVGLEGAAAYGVGFAAVLVAAVLCAFLIGRATRGLFRIAGLGVFDSVLGAGFSALKMVVFVGLVVALIDVFDTDRRIVRRDVRDGSAVYGVVDGVCGAVFPFVRDMFVGR